ncbi:MAG: NADH-quinone oxidoreductase subunit J [Saprospiraceae bacterium]|nr:NADH-quinone oxidoreductase subunit J [Saprospiraceae bacterium]HMW39380.1 NADH-quinone oxidoreductase subunit J [Saprospiraceae bacterium]HMX89207.1 NADH-quinone oxidoreductase subunit J [Saprospiraceae bacterium]HMZ41143.1 NADH-quinone oxidoreductase subunit J [Saprospiraceae bacterium]HNA64363.1 NADH-quinone oxidoreductase subunit J [Saprospiraceae bacterium]
MIDKIFFILSALTVISASMVIISRHPMRSVLYLVLTFFLISAHYVLMNAQFLALVNIVVYAGAIMVLFLFVIMFLNLNKEIEQHKGLVIWLAAIIAGGSFMLLTMAALSKTTLPQATDANYNIGLVENLGATLYKEYLLPMEISSVLFLIAMAGVVLLGRKEKIIVE